MKMGNLVSRKTSKQKTSKKGAIELTDKELGKFSGGRPLGTLEAVFWAKTNVYPDSIHWRKTACQGVETRF
jgi:hypothetical protein